MLHEDKYLKALTELNDTDFNKKNWLINNFEIYKLTLNWPSGLPPINRSDLQLSDLGNKFISTYFDILSEFNFELINENQTLKI